MSDWHRVMPGVYRHRREPSLEVKTFCECGRNCMMRWAVYIDGVAGGDRSLFFSTRAEATREAEALISPSPNPNNTTLTP